MTDHDLTRRGRWRRRVTTWAAARGRDEAGYVTMVISILIPALFIGLSATAVDTSNWYLEGERIQKAADAAALAGVPYLPQDIVSARARALEVAKRNGYDDASPDVTVTATLGDRNTQLRVTISSSIKNQFGQIIGVNSTTITRSATADFTGPAPMGSPCNTFGVEPPAGGGPSSPAPTGSAIGLSRPANCPQNPEMWATVEGPDTPKEQGDRYSTKGCSGGEDGCSGSSNSEYPESSDKKGERGYFWTIKVQPSMVGRQVQLQLYDPAFVLTGPFCNYNTNRTGDELPSRSSLVDDMNPYVIDGKSRYPNVDTIPPGQKPPVTFCSGDYYPTFAAPWNMPSNPNLTTTFLVREQTDTQDPTQAPVVGGCAKQYGSFTAYPTADNLRSGTPTYSDQLAAVFHNWTSLCTFTPTRAGDYYLQVRTNKSYTFPAGELVRTVPAGEYGALSSRNGDSSPSGYGTNSFAIRAVTAAGLERGVAVSGWDRMPIFANSEAASSIFPLIRVLPGAAGQNIVFSFFDVGDASGSGTVTVKVLLPYELPAGAVVNPFPGSCTAQGGAAGSGQTLVSCQATGITSSTNNGKTEWIRIPIPPDYTCDPSVFTNCWYRVQVSFSTGDVNDITTWDATIEGDPVRLVQ